MKSCNNFFNDFFRLKRLPLPHGEEEKGCKSLRVVTQIHMEVKIGAVFFLSSWLARLLLLFSLILRKKLNLTEIVIFIKVFASISSRTL